MKSILIIGPGKLGTSLYRALSESGCYNARLAGPAEFKIDKKTAENYTPEIDGESIAKAEIIFITVPDDNITQVKDELLKFNLSGRVVLHTSGASSSGLLAGLKEKDAFIGSFHPVQTFSRPFLPKEIWEDTICSYEGNDQGKGFLQDMCTKLKARLIFVNERQKTAVHLAAVISANYFTGLLAWAENILKDENIDNSYIKDIIYPISRQVLSNYRNNETKDILSGPVLRGDIRTIQKHLDFLESKEQPEKDLYKALAEQLITNDEFKIQRRQELINLLNEK